jgi:hypothetical protein
MMTAARACSMSVIPALDAAEDLFNPAKAPG